MPRRSNCEARPTNTTAGFAGRCGPQHPAVARPSRCAWASAWCPPPVRVRLLLCRAAAPQTSSKTCTKKGPQSPTQRVLRVAPALMPPQVPLPSQGHDAGPSSGLVRSLVSRRDAGVRAASQAPVLGCGGRAGPGRAPSTMRTNNLVACCGGGCPTASQGPPGTSLRVGLGQPTPAGNTLPEPVTPTNFKRTAPPGWV